MNYNFECNNFEENRPSENILIFIIFFLLFLGTSTLLRNLHGSFCPAFIHWCNQESVKWQSFSLLFSQSASSNDQKWRDDNFKCCNHSNDNAEYAHRFSIFTFEQFKNTRWVPIFINRIFGRDTPDPELFCIVSRRAIHEKFWIGGCPEYSIFDHSW